MLAGVLGCGKGSSGGDTRPPPVFAAADPSKTCPAGYVGWDFATGGGVDPFPDLLSVKSISCELHPLYSDDDRNYMRQKIFDDCNAFQSCTVGMPCEGDLVLTYTCGNSDVVLTESKPASEGPITLSCYIPTGADGGVLKEETPTGKACVPKHCPLDSYRDAEMQCQPGPKQLPQDYMFGPPTAIPLQKTSANENAERLVAGTEYLFVSTLQVKKRGQPRLPFPAPDGRLVYWLADEYVRKDGTGEPVQGFRCTAASAHVTSSNILEYEPDVFPNWIRGRPPGLGYVTTRAAISPECVREEFAQAAKQDAARRAGVALADFDKQYELQRLRLHTSFDLEAHTLVPDSVATRVQLPDNTCAPNPPGFFYHAHPDDKSKSYIDWIGYYRQREIAAYDFDFYAKPRNGAVHGSAEQHAFFFSVPCGIQYGNASCNVFNATDHAVGTPFGTRSSELATRIRMSATYLRVNKPEVNMRAFGNSTASVRVDVGYRLAGGDNKSNPYSFGGPNAPGVESLSDRGLRADVYIHPDGSQPFDESLSTAIGSVALRDGPVTGASVAGSVSISRKKMERFFSGDWKDKDKFRLYYCLGGTGLSVMNGRGLQHELPVVENDGVSYGAGFDADGKFCIEGDSVVVVTRDYTRTPNDPASATPNFENSRDESSGDNNTSGSQGNGAEQSCTGSSCKLRQRGEMASSGMFGKSIFDSNSDTVETRGDDDSGTVKMAGTTEALGFQVIDSSDMEAFDWGGASTADRNGLVVTRSIDWSAIEDAIDEANQGNNVEASTGKYGGRDGLGIAYGYRARMNIGPIPGEVNVGVSAGVGLALTFKLSVLPAQDYPCTGTDENSDKCYQVVSNQATQADARSACAKLGAILFEPRNSGEMADLRTLIASQGGDASRFWVGGQQGYEYVGAGCASAETQQAQQACAAAAKLSYRWLSDDEVFASAQGFGDPTVADDQFVTTADLRLTSRLPSQEGAVAFDETADRLVLRAPNELMPAVCEFVPASSVDYLSISGGIGVGASAGLYMQYCTPSEDLGICLNGTINFVSVTLGYTMGQQTYTLVDATDNSRVTIGASTMDVPWSLSILSGQIEAIFKLFFFDISVPIVSWPGFAVANGSLFQRTVPVVSRQPVVTEAM